MPIDPVKIPQNVQIEDRVVGPLSLRQIIIMAIGGGFSYMIYAAVQKSAGHVGIPLTILIWIPALIAAAFAMVNINDLSLLRICFLLLERTQKPGLRTWGPRQGMTITIRTSLFKEEKNTPAVAGPAKASATEQIAHLSTVVDRPTETTPNNAIEGSTTAPSDDIADDRTVAAKSTAEDASPSRPKLPVNPDRIQVDMQASTPPQLSDLSVFRDIFPPNTTWQS